MFLYRVAALGLTTNATPSTETANMALRQATRGFSLNALALVGKAAAATVLNGIAIRVRRWTTAGSGGTAATPFPTHDRAPAASTVAATGTPTAGTVDGSYHLATGMSASASGGWVAEEENAKINVDAGTADELDVMSHAGSASLPYEMTATIEE